MIGSRLNIQHKTKAKGSWAAKVKIGAKSQDRDLGNVYIWPHSHYQTRQYNEVSEWGKLWLRYKPCKCGCKIIDLVKIKTGHLSLLSFLTPSPFALLTPIQLPHPLSPWSPTLPATLRIHSHDITGCFGSFFAEKFAFSKLHWMP